MTKRKGSDSGYGGSGKRKRTMPTMYEAYNMFEGARQGIIPPVIDRTWGQFGGEVAGSLMGAATGGAAAFFETGGNPVAAVAGGIRGAFAGDQIARGIEWGGDMFDLFTQNNNTNPHLPLITKMSTYSGKLTKSHGKGTIEVRNKYQKNGAVAICETFGSVQDPDMLAVGHVTFQLEAVIRAISYALLRKLLRKSGVIVEDTSSELNIINFVDSGDFRLIWVTMDSDGSIAQTEYGINNDATMDSVVVGSGLMTAVENMIKSQNPAKIQKIGLLETVGITGTRLVSVLYMKQEKIDITVNAHTVIQNRTLSASASESSLAVSAQPLKGPIFEFSGIPKTKHTGLLVLNSFQTAAGVMLFRRGQLTGGDLNAWAEPPVRKAFNNVTKSSYVRLAPGELRDMEASKEWSGYFENILCGRFRYAAENAFVSMTPGISQVVFLEEELNSGSDNKINIAYETQHTCGVLLTTSNAANLQPYYQANAYNNF